MLVFLRFAHDEILDKGKGGDVGPCPESLGVGCAVRVTGQRGNAVRGSAGWQHVELTSRS
jgi:hypothetical protein